MRFDVYYPFFSKKAGRLVPGIEPHPMEWAEIKQQVLQSEEVREKVERHRQGDPDAKVSLPSICFVGQCTKTRLAANMIPTQLVMIDIDDCQDARGAWETIKERLTWEWICDNVVVVHVTPSRGLHLFFKAQSGLTTLKENMDWLNERAHFGDFGDYDEVVHDFARVSFAFPVEDLLFENTMLYLEVAPQFEEVLVNDGVKGKAKGGTAAAKGGDDAPPTFTEEELNEMNCLDYDGTPLVQIVEKYVEVYGKPGPMKVHNYYNTMVKHFRNIMNNDRRIIFALLPRFGHSDEECWSQVCSITRSNTISRLEKDFYFFLKDNDFYKGKNMSGSLYDYMASEEVAVTPQKVRIPYLPPVIKELLGTAPDDFKMPLLDALLPILGTLTSYVGAKYYYGKNEYHTTSFFSVVYAPAGTGKGFCNDFMDLLLQKIKQRDYIQNARETIYLDAINKKGDNEKKPDDPHTSLRIIYPKNSEAEFLGKQKDNKGYHMFTFAAEMDSWAKGIKAAGGNKDDMLRIAWDNGDYGQNFKSASTVKGGAKLYWNVLITGTLPQVQKYFKNVENGLVTRTSFCSIDNQEFADAPVWKELTEKQREVVMRFINRCDERSYTEPCNLFPEDVDAISPKDFDKEVDWHFTFRPRRTIDMGWLKEAIEKWLQKQLKQAARDYDKARDVFRRRCAVRGFRLGLICTQLWENPRPSDLKKCIPFIEWFMDNDMEQMMKLWAKAYNEVASNEPNLTQVGVFQALPDRFTTNDVISQCLKRGIKSPVRAICYQWKKFGFITKINKNEFQKTKRHE